MKTHSWSVFFVFNNNTRIVTNIFTQRDDYSEAELIRLASDKLWAEMSIDVNLLGSERADVEWNM